jgi:hypothetical protein
VARVLIHEPKVLLLDEPASGLDPRARIEMRGLLQELGRMGKALMVSSHILSELAEMCTSIGIIERGRLLYAGSIQEAYARTRPGQQIDIRLEGDGPALAAAMAALLLVYNRRLKGTPVLGNLAVALLCALAVWFTEFPLPPRGALPAALFALLATFARELVKDAEDVAGDRAAGLRTLAVAAGAGTARKLAFATIVALLALLPVPMTMGYGWPYAAAVVLLAGPALVPLLGELARPDANFARASRLLKFLMIAGMIALWAGTLGR